MGAKEEVSLSAHGDGTYDGAAPYDRRLLTVAASGARSSPRRILARGP
jgi:hypothetical protein